MVDQCYNWLLTGDIGKVKYSVNRRLGKMPNTEKYALSFDGVANSLESWIEVENTSKEEMELLIGYMTTSLASSKYPLIETMRDNGERFILNPLAGGFLDKEVHVTSFMNVGQIRPFSKAHLDFRTLEGGNEWPF
eukprot:8193147-Ditylum_brightwellii.AAC.1